jgi:hypothetical protein
VESGRQRPQVGERRLRSEIRDDGISQFLQHERERRRSGGELLPIVGGFRVPVLLLDDDRQQPFARVGEGRANPRRQVVHRRPVQRLLHHEHLECLFGLTTSADGDEAEDSIEPNRLSILA